MIHQFQLKNGLKVFLIESHKAPVVSLQAWVRTGSADESPKEAGLSHFIEHLLFKGTRKFKMGEIAQIIEGSGGELNAYTSFDQTVFYMTLSNRFMDMGLEALSEMMGFPAFDQSEIDAEREVVIEEMRRGQDSLGRRASQLLFSTAYSGHPYGRPVIGFENIIRKVNSKTIKSYFDTRYVPKNMFLVITGDFQKPEAKKLIDKHFGQLQPKKLRVVKRSKVMSKKKPQIKVEASQFEQSISYLGWPIPTIQHKDTPALDLLAHILGAGESSRLVQRLRIQEPLVQSIGASTFTPRQEGLFLVSFSFQQTEPQRILDLISEEVGKVIKEGVSAEEIQRGVTAIHSSEVYSEETVDGLAQKFGNLEFYFNDVRMTERYLKRLRSLKSADLVAVAKKYLKPELTVAVSLTKEDPKNSEKLLKTFVKSYEQAFAAKTVPGKSKAIKHPKFPKPKLSAKTPALETVDLGHGAKLLLRHATDTSTFSVRVATLGGVRLETEDLSGVGEMTSRTWTSGTSNFSEIEIAEKTESIAASISPVSGRNSVSLGLDALSGFQKPALEIFFDLLQNPTFPKTEFDREKQILMKQIQSRKDNPAQICIQRFMEKLFQGHPYQRDPMGRPEDLKSMTSKDAMSWWKNIFSQGKKHVFIAGAFDRDLWIEAMRKFFSDNPTNKENTQKFQTKYPQQEVRVFEKVEKEQSHLVVGYPGLNFFDSDRYALQLMQSVLAGQGGRLFLELRDKNSLAYSVAPLRMEGIEGGYFGAYIGCAPGKVATAEKMMLEEFKKLCDVKVGEEELNRAKRYTVGRYDIDLQRTGSIASSVIYNQVYGLDPNEPFTCADKYWAVTATEIMELAQKIFSQPAVKSLVGPNDF